MQDLLSKNNRARLARAVAAGIGSSGAPVDEDDLAGFVPWCLEKQLAVTMIDVIVERGDYVPFFKDGTWMFRKATEDERRRILFAK